MVADAIPAGAGQALAEGADDKIRFAYDAGLFHQAPAFLAQHSQGMGLVHQQHGSMGVFHLDEFADAGLVPQHAVDAFDDDQGVCRARSQAFQAFVQVVGVIVAETHDVGPAQAAPVVDAGMAVGVYDYGVFVVGQAGYHRQVGLVAGGEHDRLLASVERGEFPFQFPVAGKAAVGHSRPGRPRAQFIQRGMGRSQAFLVEGQAQVVVGAGQDRPFAVYARLRGRVDFVDGRAERVDALAQQAVPVLDQGLEFVKQAHVPVSVLMTVCIRSARSLTVCTSASRLTGMDMSNSSSISISRSRTLNESRPSSVTSSEFSVRLASDVVRADSSLITFSRISS